MNPYAVIVFLVVLILSNAGSFLGGRSYEAGEQAKELYDQAVAYAGKIVETQRAVDDLGEELEQAKAEKKVRDRIIVKEVVRYETIVPADRRCELDGAWRVLHDAAATGQPAESAGLATGEAEAVADSAALDVVSENYADCRDWSAQVEGWNRFWERVKRNHGGSAK